MDTLQLWKKSLKSQELMNRALATKNALQKCITGISPYTHHLDDLHSQAEKSVLVPIVFLSETNTNRNDSMEDTTNEKSFVTKPTPLKLKAQF